MPQSMTLASYLITGLLASGVALAEPAARLTPAAPMASPAPLMQGSTPAPVGPNAFYEAQQRLRAVQGQQFRSLNGKFPAWFHEAHPGCVHGPQGHGPVQGVNAPPPAGSEPTTIPD